MSKNTWWENEILQCLDIRDNGLAEFSVIDNSTTGKGTGPLEEIENYMEKNPAHTCTFEVCASTLLLSRKNAKLLRGKWCGHDFMTDPMINDN